jgi:hypothetical protein
VGVADRGGILRGWGLALGRLVGANTAENSKEYIMRQINIWLHSNAWEDVEGAGDGRRRKGIGKGEFG